MIRIIVEGRAKTGKSTVAHLIAEALHRHRIPYKLEDADGDMRNVEHSIESRLDAVRCHLREKEGIVTIAECQLGASARSVQRT